MFSIVKPQSADWLDGLTVSRQAAAWLGLIAGQAAELLVSLARATGVSRTQKLNSSIAIA